MAYVAGPARRRRQGIYSNRKWSAAGYPLLSSRYNYRVEDVCVKAELTETYEAQTDVERDVSYIFEVPPEASVCGFAAQINDDVIEGVVEEKQEAGRIYKEAVSSGVQAWKLDELNEEVFQISLGNVKPNSTLKILVRYAYIISSDTLEDSVRLTVPCGLAERPGNAPAKDMTLPRAPAGQNAVTITVGIQTANKASVLNLNSVSHHATITPGFATDAFKPLTPDELDKQFERSRAFVEFTSAQFLHSHFVLTWRVARVDHGRCLVEKLEAPADGQKQTYAFALTLVSNIELDADEHEYIFLMDKSGSMGGRRIQAANDIVKAMLDRLPTAQRSLFNIYTFNTQAKSLLANQQSMNYDTASVASAKGQLSTAVSGGTDIAAALDTVLKQRNTSQARCSIIIVTDGLDWNVKAAMRKIQDAVAQAATQDKLLRVFVMGIGDQVSRNMCEAVARVGSGATAYVSESLLQDRDHQEIKADTLINAINRAPIMVRSIDWGITAAKAESSPTQSTKPSAMGRNQSSRRQPDASQLGAAAKGANLPPPKAIQQAPQPGTLFWAVRSYWYAIIDGEFGDSDYQVTIKYDVPGLADNPQGITMYHGEHREERVVHTLAARALIQTLEDSLNASDADRYWQEAEIIRLGKTYSLASSQTSFVATMRNLGLRTKAYGHSGTAGGNPLFGASAANGSVPRFDFVKTQNPGDKSRSFDGFSSSEPANAPPPPYSENYVSASSLASDIVGALSRPSTSFQNGDDDGYDDADDLFDLIAAQKAGGTFDTDTVSRIVFRRTDVPAVPNCISVLQGNAATTEQIWLTICVLGFFQTKYSQDKGEWAVARSHGEKFVKNMLNCLFDLDAARCDEVFAQSLEIAQGYF